MRPTTTPRAVTVLAGAVAASTAVAAVAVLSSGVAGPNAPVVGVLGVLLAAGYVVSGQAAWILGWDGSAQRAQARTARRLGALLALAVVLLATGVTSGDAVTLVLLEEVLFRGLPLLLLHRWGRVSKRTLSIAAAASATAFLLVHDDQGTAASINRIAFGIALFVIAWRYQELVLATTIHLVSNAIWDTGTPILPSAALHALDALLLIAALCAARFARPSDPLSGHALGAPATEAIVRPAAHGGQSTAEQGRPQ